MKNLVLRIAPVWFQNLAISVFNRRQWWVRQRGAYRPFLMTCEDAAGRSQEEWQQTQDQLVNDFLKFAVTHSEHYKGIDHTKGLSAFPILEKHTLINDFDRIKTIPEKEGIVSYTGGTTGASMKVVYTVTDVQKRFAILDWFRGLSGWTLGQRTAWFSGKAIVRDSDIKNGLCYRDDWLTKTRFFSTFHVNSDNFEIYWNALIDFNPKYIVGFPSSLGDILTVAQDRGLTYPHKVIAIFPTAETVLPHHRKLFLDVLGAHTLDQYASSEGAPFIVECNAGHKHILPYTGIFEVIDEQGQPARTGEILVTAFHTHGTPLIRYRIGDRITLCDDDTACACGWSFPRVSSIDGRTADFVWSPQYGKINLGNLSNATKGVPGIIAFRVLQTTAGSIRVEVEGSDLFDEKAISIFDGELRKRTGTDMQIEIVKCDHLPRKASGKFRIVENSLTEDQMVLSDPS
jgi:phenylacetate-CoA ligase